MSVTQESSWRSCCGRGNVLQTAWRGRENEEPRGRQHHLQSDRLKGCYRCGWNPDVALARKAKLREKLNAKPPTKTRPKKRPRAVTWK